MRDLPKNLDRFLTRRGAVQFLNDKGLPVRFSTINKMSMLGRGPKPDLFYGRRELFLVQTIERWAQEHLLSDNPTMLRTGGRKDQHVA
jgi:hypothetical protein